jgi:LemA protein
LAFARQAYNDVVLNYNTRIQSVPTNFIANNFGFTPAEYFKIDETDKAVPKVDLSLNAPHA